MCGLIGVIAKNGNENNEFIINQFEDQNARGKEGFGIIRIKQGKIEGIDRACTPMKFLMDLYTHKAESLIVHHRTPTSSENKLAQTHPINIKNKELAFDYLVMHNGVIQNDNELKEKHEKIGYTYTTEYLKENHYNTNTISKWNDSESFAIDLIRFIEKKQPELKMTGSTAFIAIQIKKDTNQINKIYFGRKNNPINIQEKKGLIYLSSEGPGKEIESHKLFSVNLAKIKLKKNGEFIIQNKNLKFKNERLEKEEEKRQDKELKKRIAQNNKTISNFSTNSNNSFSFPYKSSLTPSKEPSATDLKLQELETEYWEKVTQNKERTMNEISFSLDNEFIERRLLIDEIINEYLETIIEPGYDAETSKINKQTVMSSISKILSTITKIAEYESICLEQAEIKEEEENTITKNTYDIYNGINTSYNHQSKNLLSPINNHNKSKKGNWKKKNPIGFE